VSKGRVVREIHGEIVLPRYGHRNAQEGQAVNVSKRRTRGVSRERL